ncbi:hypothetical protein HBI24_115740 [Parastagonospora nodorum]|nr:hypothetical protein HBI09_112310 [Parastagonospora nodorum]KAH4355230.1 hypothetical protein HBH94_240060 [Parastagonospora nodorum]KAH4473421.1 hypothetical protein HBH88_244210 [Parastagonospora nodorum]KAH4499615.1 hypothetical protein HBH89_124410 [Parastagonospora nodorum]KAH4548442.1 hypothetical protein HBH86_126950 [Parastagonospora nodorum]
MFDLDKGMPVQDDGPSSSESPANETAEAGMYEPGGDGDNVIDSDNDVEMGNQDDQDCESDDEGLFREDQVSRKTLVAVYDLAYELDAAITAAADTPAADMLDFIDRMNARDDRRELTHGPMHSDKEGETRVRWLVEERAAFEKFVDMHAAELQRIEDDVKPPPLQAKFDCAWENRHESLRSPFWDGCWRDDLYQLWDMCNGSRFVKEQQHSQATISLISGELHSPKRDIILSMCFSTLGCVRLCQFVRNPWSFRAGLFSLMFMKAAVNSYAPPSASMLTESAGERCLMASKLVLREIDESWVGESM